MEKVLLFHADYNGRRFRYGVSLRPVEFGGVPEGWIINSTMPHGKYAHGTVDYPRKLSLLECTGFDLEFVQAFPENCNGCQRLYDLVAIAEVEIARLNEQLRTSQSIRATTQRELEALSEQFCLVVGYASRLLGTDDNSFHEAALIDRKLRESAFDVSSETEIQVLIAIAQTMPDAVTAEGAKDGRAQAELFETLTMTQERAQYLIGALIAILSTIRNT